jgi:hypothetical protein
MDLQKLVLWAAPFAYVFGVAYFFRIAAPAQRKPCLLGWLVPGLGHWIVGRRDRAIFFGLQILGLFVAGLLLSDFRCVSPLDRHPVWAVIQVPCGGPFLLAAAATASLEIVRDSAFYQVGCLYTAVACLLNVVALCDLYDLTEPAERRDARRPKEGAAS